jgi:hypothetical protein
MLITSRQEYEMPNPDRTDEIKTQCELLVRACGQLGLVSHQGEGPGQVYAAAPGNGMLSEVVTCRPDGVGVLMWYWSWDEPFCLASEIARAAAMIANVVATAHV